MNASFAEACASLCVVYAPACEFYVFQALRSLCILKRNYKAAERAPGYSSGFLCSGPTRLKQSSAGEEELEAHVRNVLSLNPKNWRKS